MAKKKVNPEELEFCRSLTAYDSHDVISTSFISNPYCVGMYVVVDGDIQLSIPNKKFDKWVKDAVKKMEGLGLRVETHYLKYSQFLSIDQINDYILN